MRRQSATLHSPSWPSSTGSSHVEDVPQSESRPSKRPHETTTTTTTASTRQTMCYPRKRAVTACQLCRARKTKCSNTRPSCELCSKLGAQCQYDDRSNHSSFDPASLEMLHFLNRIFERQNDVLHIVRGLKTGLPQSHEQRDDHFTPGAASANFGSVSSSALQENNTWQYGINDPLTDSLKIPSSRIIPDSILAWPIFESRYPASYLQDAVFESAGWGDGFTPAEMTSSADVTGVPSQKTSRPATMPFREEEVLKLVDRFLSLVHIKNPIVDEDALRSGARKVVEDGLSWDGQSCLVLLACSLGIIATPFDIGRAQATLSIREYKELPSNTDPLLLDRAESYFVLARKRIGLLSQSIIACQCYFLSGVYLMYTLRPVEAFRGFHQASILYMMCLKWGRQSPVPRKTQKLEQRLYWSCFKSECELLSEIPLMESGIADFSYPHMFPSPPDMGIDQEFAVIEDGTDESPNMNAPLIPRHGSFLRREQEQSWFYYLSEISLRRIGNRVINTFYQDLDYDQAWLHMDAEAMTHIAEEFMSLLNQWHIGLPPLVRFHAENLNEVPDEELAFMLRARVLEIRSWIFRPFLFYAIHHPETDPQQHLLWSWVQQAMHNSFLLIETSSLPHRHHGVWYTLRVAMIAAFSLIAAAKNRLQMPDGWRGAVQLAIETLRHWELEGPEDVRKSRVILEELLRNMQEEPGDERLDTQPQNDV